MVVILRRCSDYWWLRSRSKLGVQVVVVVLISLLYCSVQSQILKHKEERNEKDKTMLYVVRQVAAIANSIPHDGYMSSISLII